MYILIMRDHAGSVHAKGMEFSPISSITSFFQSHEASKFSHLILIDKTFIIFGGDFLVNGNREKTRTNEISFRLN